VPKKRATIQEECDKETRTLWSLIPFCCLDTLSIYCALYLFYISVWFYSKNERMKEAKIHFKTFGLEQYSESTKLFLMLGIRQYRK